MPDAAGAPEPAALERVAADVARTVAALVTTDLQADAGRLVAALLAEATPGAGLLLADGTSTAPAAPLQWLVDAPERPADADREVPVVALAVAAALDGDVVAGAVVDVVRGEWFSARRDGGALRDDEPIAVSTCDGLAGALVAASFSRRPEDRVREGEVASRVLAGARDLRCFGAPALELCWVACGRLDGYIGRGLAVGRYAAGALVAGEAGAVTELPCPENDDLVIAAAPGVFDALRAVAEHPATGRSS